MKDFVYHTSSEHIIFGKGNRFEIGEALSEEFGKRVLIITTAGRRDDALEIASTLRERCIGIYDKAVQHVPNESVKELLQILENVKADSLLSIGGGSAIGLAKGAVLHSPLPIAVIPTTYSGSEMTPVWGITKAGVKTTGKNDSVKPRVVIYDPELTESMPAYLSLTSGMNALAHAVEALYAKEWEPVTALLAEESIRVLYNSLGKIVEDPTNMEARSDALYGSWLSGKVLGKVNMALQHKLCHVLGGYNLPHAETHTVVLPYVLSYQSSHVPDAMHAIARALGHIKIDNVVPTLHSFVQEHNGPSSLKELNLHKEHIEPIVHHLMNQQFYNPRPLIREELENMIWKAYEGDF